jgi:hypothetical protein
MDLREIQRLHAQFAPDSMTIDLPRQIAALPAPVLFESNGKPSKLTSRMAKTGPFLRSCAKPLLIAVVVAMAGVGAARIWHAFGTGTVSPKSPADQAVSSKANNAPPPALASEAAPRPIDASPAHPVTASPTLSASDLGNEPTVGLTADQFRNSLGPISTGSTGNAGAAKATLSLSNESKLAAVSPIRQSHRESEAAHGAFADKRQLGQTELKSPAQQVAMISSAPQAPAAALPGRGVESPAPIQAAERDTPSSPTAARAHSYKRATVSTPDQQGSGSDLAPAGSHKKATPASHAGSTEVQMF